MAVVENENRALLQQLGIVEQSAQHLKSQLRALQAEQDQLTVPEAEQERCSHPDTATTTPNQQQLNDAAEQLNGLTGNCPSMSNNVRHFRRRTRSLLPS